MKTRECSKVCKFSSCCYVTCERVKFIDSCNERFLTSYSNKEYKQVYLNCCQNLLSPISINLEYKRKKIFLNLICLLLEQKSLVSFTLNLFYSHDLQNEIMWDLAGLGSAFWKFQERIKFHKLICSNLESMSSQY